MPTYDYRCKSCDHQFEEFQSIKADPLVKCPSCGKNQLVRLISGGAAIVFKGSGFYQTDYRSESYKRGASESKKQVESNSVNAGNSASSSKDSTKSPQKADNLSKNKPA